MLSGIYKERNYGALAVSADQSQGDGQTGRLIDHSAKACMSWRSAL